MKSRNILEGARKQLLAASSLVLVGMSVVFSAAASEFELHLAAPEFVLPQFTGPYTDREASISPEEYETAERLKSLLEAGQKQEVLEELEGYYDIELSPAMLALKGQIYTSLGIYEKAEATYLGVLRRQPQLVRVHSDLAQLYLVQDKFAEARKHFSRAVELGSNDAIVHGQLAYLNLTQFGPFSAISSYQAAMAIEPENQQWQRGLLAALTQANMFESAQALLKELIVKRPDDSQLWLNGAALALHKGDYKEALVGLEMAITLGDDDSRNLKTAAQLHLQLGHNDRALVLLNQGVKKQGLAFEVIDEAVDWLIQTRALAEARELLDLTSPRINDLNSKERSRYYKQLASLSQADRTADAEAYYLKSLAADPANGEALVAYAEYLAEAKRSVEAELIYMRAEAIQTVEKEAMLGRAQLYIDQRDYTSALNILSDVLRRYPAMRELIDNIETLESVIRTTNSVVDPSA